MIAEADLFGVYVPALLIWGLIALLLYLVLKRVLSSVGLYRYVWHSGLFDVALYVILVGGVTVTADALFPFGR
jgi:hypothetical protein